jgi:magnesium chelatase subunit I
VNTIQTLGELKESGFKSKSIKDELRDNLISKIKNKENVFEGILGYEHTVIPDIERAILSGHSINMLGLRGQAKTRIARQMINLLDPYIPIVKGSEINDDPLHPISKFAIDRIEQDGDKTEIEWLSRSERYVEKLATPDVSVADLIGDLDPVKAINQKLSYSDEKAIHFGLIPRSNRCIFVINELPDLQARIQVALFNILQEGDIQIRGFKIRLPLDIQFIFTANPEDYTNRGSIVTPLKDRIGSQIITHYPKTIEIAKQITRQEAKIRQEQKNIVSISPILENIIEQVVFEARKSEYVDSKSGVSARLSISAYENLVSAAERRALFSNDETTQARISDLQGVIPAITGKVEMVYEGEQEGPYKVAQNLVGNAIKTVFSELFPKLNTKSKKNQEAPNPYQNITEWFDQGNHIDLPNMSSNKEFYAALDSLPPLREFVTANFKKLDAKETYLMMELLLFGLSEHSKLSKHQLETSVSFKDLFGSVFSGFSEMGS